MTPLPPNHAAAALQLLADPAVERDNEIAQFSPHRLSFSSDDDADSPCPLFDTFYNEGGAEAIRSMTNVLPRNFELLWNHLSEYVTQTYNVGRGQRSKVSGKDALFITMTVLKHGGQWDMLARVFSMKGPTFEGLVTRFVSLISQFVFDCFVEKVGELNKISDLRTSQQNLKSFPEAPYATDVTFQQAFRPSGSIEEGKR